MQTIENINKTIQENMAVMLYFSAPTCNVCHALKPKLIDALDKKEVETSTKKDNITQASQNLDSNEDDMSNEDVMSLYLRS